MAIAGDGGEPAMLDLEQAANALVVQAGPAAWKVGNMSGNRGRTGS